MIGCVNYRLRMFKVRIIAGFALLLCCQVALGQNVTLSTGNKYVKAWVQPGTGLLWLTIPPDGPTAPLLSFKEKSFLTVNLNGRIYTNNQTGVNRESHPQFAGYLTGGYNQKIGDTIRTTWYNINNCDVIQEVYPALLDTSGQIVMRWKVRNLDSAVPIFAQCQFLLDLQVGAEANDDAPVLTRYGYRPIWEQYTSSTTPYGIPWYFAAFERRPSGNPGVIGVGYTQDKYYKLGLKRPAVMTVGDWKYPFGYALVDYLWGPPPNAPWGQNYGDAAILYQWDVMGVLPGKTSEIARTSYGTPEFALCPGEIFGIVFYPRRFKWDTKKYDPNPGEVEFYAFNTYSPIPGAPDFGQAASNTRVKLEVGPSLRIIDPPADPGSNNTIGTLLTSPDSGFIPQRSVGTAFWKIAADKARNCYDAVDSWLKFTVSSSLGVSGCEHPVKVDCVEEDREPPMADKESKTRRYPYIDTFTVHDDRPTDRGIDKIQWVPTPGSNTNSAKFAVKVTPGYIPCYRKPYTVTITQLDSTIGGCFDFTLIDCAGNDTTYAVCLPPHPVPVIPDMLPPLVATIEKTPGYPSAPPCNGRCDSLLLSDNRRYDKGLKRIEALAMNNMELRTDTIISGEQLHRGKVCVTDTMLDGSITLRVWDVADNYTDTTYRYCTIPDTLAPKITITDDKLNRGHWTVIVEENRDWDRRIDSIEISSINNVYVSSSPPYTPWDRDFYLFEVSVLDSTKSASFCVRAKDRAENWSVTLCTNLFPDPDTLCPNFTISPPIMPFVTNISVAIDDYHVNATGDTIRWDKGIDSVWFTNARGILVPDPMSYDCEMKIPPFTLRVEDTLDVDSIASATVHVLDCAGNTCAFDWRYPYNPDSLPPLIFARYKSRTNIEVYVTDSALYDRGVKRITLNDRNNFSPLIVDADRTLAWGPGLLTRSYSQSSTGALEAVDYWGALASNMVARDSHTASIDLSVWIQDLAMKKGEIVTEPGAFELPIQFIRNDTFALKRKGIDAFKFTFEITGNPEAVTFAGIDAAGTAAETWNIAWTPVVANTYEVTGTSGGTALSGDLAVPFLKLQFLANQSDVTKDVIVAVVPDTNGERLVYNNGTDRIVTGKNALAILPAPYGALSGSNIVILGACAPVLETGSQLPSVVSLEQNSPNPFSGKTSFRFTIMEEGFVKMAVYDMLGKEVASLVNGVLARGRYTIALDGSQYSSGAYVARLQANGDVRSRLLRIER